MLISTVDKKPAVEVSEELTSSTTKSHDSSRQMSLSRRLGIRDLPMPPMPPDADDDVDDDETDAASEQDQRQKEDDLCDIVKSFVRSKQASTSPGETYQQSQHQYVLTVILLIYLFINYMVYMHVKSFTVSVKNRKCISVFGCMDSLFIHSLG